MKAYRYWAHALVVSGLVSGACGGGLPYPGVTADEVFNIGRQALQDENWNEAIKAFDHVLIMSAFARSAEARYYLASRTSGVNTSSRRGRSTSGSWNGGLPTR